MDSVREWPGFSEEDLRRIKAETDVATAAVGDNELQQEVSMASLPSPPAESRPAAFVESTSAVVKSKKSKNKKSSISRLSTSKSGVPTTLDIRESLKTTTVLVDHAMTKTSVVESDLPPSTPSRRLPIKLNRSSTSDGSRPAINGTVTLRVKEDGRAVEVVSDTTEDDPVEVSETGNGNQFENFVGCGEEMECAPKKISLEEFQQKQKMIEEQNKWRRAMLTKAIADRKKRTLAETEKLTHIQMELQKLDSLVSNDVAILRDRIEVASVEFNEIQKRYEKAEREFVEAKIDLFRKMERKERLTEHLCKIIEENELRKAKKLSELMDELELESLRDDECLNDGKTDLPQLSASNDITYAYCTTFRRPSSSTSQGTAVSRNCDDHLPEDSLRNESSEGRSNARTKHGVEAVNSEVCTEAINSEDFVDINL